MGLGSFCARHFRRLGQSLAKKPRKIANLFRRAADKNYDEISHYWQAGFCFPTRTIPFGHKVTLSRWDAIERSASPLDDEKLVKEWMVAIRGYSMVTYDGLLSLANQVRYCEENHVPGVYVETGCHRGGASAIMAKASLHYGGKPRTIHAFDSFEGLPQPDQAKDTDAWIADRWKIPADQHQGKMVATGSLAGASPEDVRDVFGKLGVPTDRLRIHKGWFCDSIPVALPEIDQIAILRLDGDLYASTWDALSLLYPKVVVGGFVVIDDYEVTGARQAVTDYLKLLPRAPYICRADGAVAYFVKQAA